MCKTKKSSFRNLKRGIDKYLSRHRQIKKALLLTAKGLFYTDSKIINYGVNPPRTRLHLLYQVRALQGGVRVVLW